MDYNTSGDPINVFDFDGTVTTETWPKFWVWVKKFGYLGERRNDALESALTMYRESHDGSPLETFFGFFNDLLVDRHESITLSELMEGEKYIEYNPGVESFLKNSVAKNYIVSGGLKEFLQNLKTAIYFDGIYGTPVRNNEIGEICGIGEVMTDEKKIDAIKDILKINGRDENDCRNVFYIGDGYSDGASMRFIHENGGKAVFVYQPNNDDALREYTNHIRELLNAEGILDYSFVADYSAGSDLSNLLNRKTIQ